MKKNFAGMVLICFVANVMPVFAIDKYFDFKNQYLPEKVEFEKKRKLCFFPFRYPESLKKYNYLSKGIPSVLFSGLNSMKFVYDEDVMPIVINYAYGQEKDVSDKEMSGRKFAQDRNTLRLLNEGKLKLLPIKDPRYIPFEMEILDAKDPALLETAIFLGRKNNCFYVVTGEYRLNNDDALFINVELTNMRDGKVYAFSETTGFKRAFQEMGKAVDKLKRGLIKKEMIAIKVDAGDEKDVLVFVDGVYLGKTPLEGKEVIYGKHELFLFKDGFIPETREINLSPQNSKIFSFTLKKTETKGAISVTSEPSGADVYLGMTHLGQTPLKNVPVQVGANQIRISKESYVDFYKGVEIEDKKILKLDAKLKSGDSEIYYKNKNNLFLDYTYYDFSLFSLFSTLFFYAGFIYADLRSSQLTDELRSQYAFANITQIMKLHETLTADEFFAVYAFQEMKIQQIRSEIKGWDKIGSNRKGHRLKGIAPAGIGVMIILSAVFYVLGLDEETIEFGMKPVHIQNLESMESYLHFHKRF